MADVYAFQAFDQNEFNLNRLLNPISADLLDKINFVINGVTYFDIYEVVWESAGTYVSSSFGGPSISVDGNDNVISGTITGYLEAYRNGDYWHDGWAVEGFSISAFELLNTAQTVDTSDDIAVVNQILSGTDTFEMSNYADRAFGRGGDDLMYGYGGSDTLVGNNGDDSISGGAGQDVLKGGSGHDNLNGKSGDDKAFGGNGRDTLYGGSGNDKLFGGKGADVMNGGSGNDVLTGQAGSDRLVGAAGNDTLKGGSGADRLSGGTGDDRMKGGAGADTFIFGPGNDVVVDFDTDLDGELINLSNAAGISDFTDLSSNHITQVSQGARITDGNGDTLLLQDVDVSSLSESDFIFT